MTTAAWPMVTLSNGTPQLGTALLDALADGRLALIRLQAALPPETLASAREAILGAPTTLNRYGNAVLSTIGPYLANRLDRLDSYFADAGLTDAVFTDPQHDPRPIARRHVAAALGLRRIPVLVEPARGSYAPAVVRLHRDGVGNPLHNDHIGRDAAASGLRVAQLTAQFSAVLCLQECDGGGELHLFRRRWSAGDEACKIRGGLGYEDGVVAGAQHIRFAPATGDIYILNPTHYHAIAPVRGRTRITLGFFFGLFDDHPGEALAWS